MFRQLGAYLLCLLLSIRLVWQVGYIGYYKANTETFTQLYCIKKNDLNSNCKAQCFLVKQLGQLGLADQATSSSRGVVIQKIDLPEFLTNCLPRLKKPCQSVIHPLHRPIVPYLISSNFELIDTPPPKA